MLFRSYKLSLYDDGNGISITLEAPEQLTEIQWPTNGVGEKLPIPASTLAKIVADRSNYFQVIVGNMPTAEYNNYIKLCEEQGFTVDYSKADTYYTAENSEGFKLRIQYIGFNQIEITISAPSPEEEITSVDNNTAEPTQPAGDKTDSSAIRKDFKAAMDSYEAFMDEYIAFMKKYANNPTDMSLLNDYANYMSSYTKYVDDFAKWNSDDLSAAEAAYYLEVLNRVNKKLLEIAN